MSLVVVTQQLTVVTGGGEWEADVVRGRESYRNSMASEAERKMRNEATASGIRRNRMVVEGLRVGVWWSEADWGSGIGEWKAEVSASDWR